MPPITETTIRLAKGVPGCSPCGCIDAATGCPCPVPADTSLVFTLARWHPKICSFTFGTCRTSVTLEDVEIPVALVSSVPGGSRWESDYFQLGWTPEVGPSDRPFLRTHPWKLLVECHTSFGLRIEMMLFDVDYGEPADLGINWVDPPPEETVFAVLEGYNATLDSYTLPDTLGSAEIFPCQWYASEFCCTPSLRASLGYNCSDPDNASENGVFSDNLDARFNEVYSLRVDGDPTTLPEGSKVCARVHTPDCGETLGDPIEGATVDVYTGGDSPTLVDSCTTDEDGICCVDVTEPGIYEARSTVGLCEAMPDRVAVGICGGTVSASLEVCSATACVVVKDNTDGTPVVKGGSVYFNGREEAETTDAEGKACTTLTTAEMLALPLAGEDCNVRLVPVRVVAEGRLDVCTTVPVTCGNTSTEDPPPILLYPLDEDGDTIDEYRRVEFACTDGGCEVVGYAGRGLIPNFPQFTIEVEVKDGGGTWHSISGTGELTLVPGDVNPGLLTGTPSGSPWEDSEFGATQPDVEYHHTGSITVDPPASINVDGVDCLAGYTAYELWVRRGFGCWVRLTGTAIGDTVRLPGDAVYCAESESRQVHFLDFVLPFDFNPCYDVEPWEVDTGWVVVTFGAGAYDLRWRVQVTL